MEPSLNIPFTFAKENFSPSWWKETSSVLAQVGFNISPTEATGGDNSPADSDEDWEAPDLSPAQARKLVANVSDRLRTACKAIAQSPETGFKVSDIVRALGDDDDASLRGVWSGMTRRVRGVLGDDEAFLFRWIPDDNNPYSMGMVSPITHRSLRKALGL